MDQEEFWQRHLSGISTFQQSRVKKLPWLQNRRQRCYALEAVSCINAPLRSEGRLVRSRLCLFRTDDGVSTPLPTASNAAYPQSPLNKPCKPCKPCYGLVLFIQAPLFETQPPRLAQTRRSICSFPPRSSHSSPLPREQTGSKQHHPNNDETASHLQQKDMPQQRTT